MTNKEVNVNKQPIIITLSTFISSVGLALHDLSLLIADHYKNKQYENTKLDVNTDASSLVFTSTSKWINTPVTLVNQSIITFLVHPPNSRNWNNIHNTFKIVKLKNKTIKLIPAHDNATPP